MKKYETMADETLIRKLREGETEIADFIVDKYKFIVRKKAKQMFLLGGENDDLIQEGMIGLFKAIRDYDLSHYVDWVGKDGAVRVRHNTYNGSLTANVAFCLSRSQQAKLLTHQTNPLDTVPTPEAASPQREFDGFRF